MPKKQLTTMLATVLVVLMLAAGVSALVFDKENVDDVKSTVSLITGLVGSARVDNDLDDLETDDLKSDDLETDDQGTAESEEGDHKITVDTTSSASKKTTGESVSLDAGSVNGITASTGQPIVDATSSASTKPSAIVSLPAADTGTIGTTPTRPVDAIASASLPKPGTTAPTSSTTADARLITESAARNIAIAAVGSTAFVKEVEFELDDYPPVYEVKLLYAGKEFKIEVHAVTGAILQVEKDEEEDEDD